MLEDGKGQPEEEVPNKREETKESQKKNPSAPTNNIPKSKLMTEVVSELRWDCFSATSLANYEKDM